MSATLQDVSRYTGVSVKALRKLAAKIGENRLVRTFGPPPEPKRKAR